MENGDALYARIAELEKENEKFKEEKSVLMAVAAGNYKRVEEFKAICRKYFTAEFIDSCVRYMDATLVSEYFQDTEEEDNDEDEDEQELSVYCYYICRHCFAFGTEDPDCTKCGKKSCVLLYTEPNSSMALAKAKADALYARQQRNEACKSAREECSSDEDEDEKCWTCGKKASHKVWRDALNEYEHTCDACHRNEYPEDYEDDTDGEDE